MVVSFKSILANDKMSDFNPYAIYILSHRIYSNNLQYFCVEVDDKQIFTTSTIC